MVQSGWYTKGLILILGISFIFVLKSSYLVTPAIGGLHLLSDSTTTMATLGTWTPLIGRFGDGNNIRFELTTSGLVYKGETSKFLFNGSSNAKSDKVALITYGLFKNSETEPIDYGFESVMNFEHANSCNGLSITRILTLYKNDTLNVKGKSSVNATDLTVGKLNVTFVQLTR